MTFAIFNHQILQALPGVLEELGLIPGQVVSAEEVKMITASNLMKMLEVMSAPKIRSEYLSRRLPTVPPQEAGGNYGYSSREEFLTAVKAATFRREQTGQIPAPASDLIGYRFPLEFFAGKGICQDLN